MLLQHQSLQDQLLRGHQRPKPRLSSSLLALYWVVPGAVSQWSLVAKNAVLVPDWHLMKTPKHGSEQRKDSESSSVETQELQCRWQWTKKGRIQTNCTPADSLFCWAMDQAYPIVIWKQQFYLLWSFNIFAVNSTDEILFATPFEFFICSTHCLFLVMAQKK